MRPCESLFMKLKVIFVIELYSTRGIKFKTSVEWNLSKITNAQLLPS